jgi:hypothetical protein
MGGGGDGHRKVGTHPMGTTDLRLRILKEPLLYRAARRKWRASVLLPVERPIDLVRTCASSPFDDDCWMSSSSHLNRQHIRLNHREISPPMLVEDTALQGEYDGVDAPKYMGEGGIHPSERHGGAARSKGIRETAEGIVLPRWW